jgi:eukaryotic-like serine/threonine-protein kinase
MQDHAEQRNTGSGQPEKKNEKGCVFTLLKHSMLAGSAFFLALIIFALTMDFIVMPFYQESGRVIDAPDFLGVPLLKAERIVESKNLSIIVDSSEYNNSYEKGTISYQMPFGGTIIKSGRRIRVRISKGPKPKIVPDIVGKSPRDAGLLIQDAGLALDENGLVWKPSNNFPHGIVAGQEPEAGQEVAENTKVILYISNGKKETNIIMPDVTGLSLTRAKEMLKASNFNSNRLKIQLEEQSDLLPGTVIEQYPDPGVPSNTNDEVILIVSTSEKTE